MARPRGAGGGGNMARATGAGTRVNTALANVSTALAGRPALRKIVKKAAYGVTT